MSPGLIISRTGAAGQVVDVAIDVVDYEQEAQETRRRAIPNVLHRNTGCSAGFKNRISKPPQMDGDPQGPGVSRRSAFRRQRWPDELLVMANGDLGKCFLVEELLAGRR